MATKLTTKHYNSKTNCLVIHANATSQALINGIGSAIAGVKVFFHGLMTSLPAPSLGVAVHCVAPRTDYFFGFTNSPMS
ncbi:MAG: hypothetical protein AAF770_01500 [Bacteroidota bacterium]